VPQGQPVPQGLNSCVGITKDTERLACFDREMARPDAPAQPAAASTAGAAAATSAVAASKPVPVTAGTGAVSPPSAPASPATTGAPGPTGAPTAIVPAAAGSPAPASTAVVGAGAVGAATGVAAAAAAAGAPGSAGVPLTPEQKMGLSPDGVHKLEAKQGVKSTEAKSLSAHITSVSRSAAGRQVFTLDNGQVWRQAETRSGFEVAPGDAVTVSSGAMGSFWLATSKHNWTRVERIP